MTSRAGAANLLGALALVVTDQTVRDIELVAGSASTSAALSALRHFLDRPSVDQLRQVLGLTHSGTVRLVDRLEADGLVTRGAGADGRSRSVALTPKGRRTADRVTGARAALLDRLIADLTTAEVDQLHSLLGKVMSRVVADKDGGAWVCRLCDLHACGRDEGRCPTAGAAAAKFGSGEVS